MTRKVVVLPQPDGPSRVTKLPFGMSRSRLGRATWLPYDFVMFLRVISDIEHLRHWTLSRSEAIRVGSAARLGDPEVADLRDVVLHELRRRGELLGLGPHLAERRRRNVGA